MNATEGEIVDPTQQDLEDAGCWFNSDKGGGTAMTAFRREARWRQHRWAVDELSVATFGAHPGRRTHPDVAPEPVPNGTKLQESDTEAGLNFLTPAIHALAKARVAERQDYQTLDARRLYRDLLSSMPMAFNLFGDAAAGPTGESRARLAELFGVANADQDSEVRFEWSPARRSPDFTRDQTAFDVALLLGSDDGPRTVIGIETKYHELCLKEPAPSARNPEQVRRHQQQSDFLVTLAEDSGVYIPGWQEAVLTTDLRQIWRDHLLALSMRRHPLQWTSATKYVLIHPSRNVSFAHAAARYAQLLRDGTDSFQAFTLEEVVDAAFTADSPTGRRFCRRYLW